MKNPVKANENLKDFLMFRGFAKTKFIHKVYWLLLYPVFFIHLLYILISNYVFSKKGE